MNALKELVETLKDNNKLLNDIDYGYIHLNSNRMEFDGHIRSHQLSLLDVEYDNDYGTQELDGTIVFKDGSWLERSEYDGSEDWVYKTTPKRDRVLQKLIDQRSIKEYREAIEENKHPHLKSTYESMLKTLLEKVEKEEI